MDPKFSRTCISTLLFSLWSLASLLARICLNQEGKKEYFHSRDITKCLCILCVCAQVCPTLRDPMDCSPPGSPVHADFQARILEWVANSYSRGSSWPRDWNCVSCISSTAGRFFTTEPPGKFLPMHMEEEKCLLFFFFFCLVCFSRQCQGVLSFLVYRP